MRERLGELIDRIHELNEERRYLANTKANCFFCRFQTLCTVPPGRRRVPDPVWGRTPAETVVGS